MYYKRDVLERKQTRSEHSLCFMLCKQTRIIHIESEIPLLAEIHPIFSYEHFSLPPSLNMKLDDVKIQILFFVAWFNTTQYRLNFV